MNKTWNPDTVAAPLGTYSQCCEIQAGSRLLHIAGQVGVLPDGTMTEEFEAQCEQTLNNIIGILEANDMGPDNITKLGIFLLHREHVATYRDIRNKVLGNIRPPGTLLIIPSLASPDWLVEVEAYAAKND